MDGATVVTEPVGQTSDTPVPPLTTTRSLAAHVKGRDERIGGRPLASPSCDIRADGRRDGQLAGPT